MQTFLPLPDMAASAAVLDDRRLGKQRVEVLQVLRALHLEGYGWASHPAVTMWQGHTPALVAYGCAVVAAWRERGYADTTAAHIAEFVHPHSPEPEGRLAGRGDLPPWWGWEPLHRSHRAALVRKDPAWYAPRFDDAPPDLEYVWPDPPAPRPVPGPVDAVVVRGSRRPGSISFAAEPGEGAGALAVGAARETKRRRQARRFVEDLRPGDVLVSPEGPAGPGERLHVGVVAGPYRRAVARHVRPVTWVGVVARRALRFPAALQDPQTVFHLHDEPDLRTVASADG